MVFVLQYIYNYFPVSGQTRRRGIKLPSLRINSPDSGATALLVADR